MDYIIDNPWMKMMELTEDDSGGDQNGGGLSDEQIDQIVQGLQDGSITEDQLKQAMDAGQMTEEDIQKIQEKMNSGDSNNDDEPKNPEDFFSDDIDKINDSFIRLSLYDKITELQVKIDDFLNNYDKVNNEYYDDIKHIKGYLDVVGSLVFNLDINLLYQLVGSIQLKLINTFKKILNVPVEKSELDTLANIIFTKEKIRKIKDQYKPEVVVNEYLDGDLDDKDLANFVKYGIYTQEEIQGIYDSIQKKKELQDADVQNEILQAALGDGDGTGNLDDDQIQQIVQGLMSGDVQMEEIQDAAEKGLIDDESIQKIQEMIQQAQQGQDPNTQGDQGQPEDQGNQPGQPLDDSQINQLAQGLLSGSITQDQLIQQGISSDDMKKINNAVKAITDLQKSLEKAKKAGVITQPPQAPQPDQPDQSQGQEQPPQEQPQQPSQGLDQDQIQQLAQGLVSGEIQITELADELNSGQITSQDMEQIIQMVGVIKQQSQQAPQPAAPQQ